MSNTAPLIHPMPRVTARVDKKPARLPHIDAVRGFAVALMALDHVRHFFHAQAPLFDPTDLTQTSSGLFMTRWITHLCAPLFVLLAGMGVFLQRSRGASPALLADFLRARGLWLIAIELTVVKFGWSFNLSYDTLVVQVIWALGCAMIFLSFLTGLRARTVLALGCVGLAAHALLLLVPVAALGPFRPLWEVVVSGHTFTTVGGGTFAPKYPVLPWTALMAVGFGVGPALLRTRAERRVLLTWTGLVAFALFLRLRLFETEGLSLVTPDGLSARGLLWLVDVDKYPPSPTFLLLTTALAFFLLAGWDRPGAPERGVLSTFGRVPFFFYLLHIPFIHALAIGVEFLVRPAMPVYPENTWKVGLPAVYALWVAVLVLMYPSCRWFADLKRRRSDPWLRFL